MNSNDAGYRYNHGNEDECWNEGGKAQGEYIEWDDDERVGHVRSSRQTSGDKRRPHNREQRMREKVRISRSQRLYRGEQEVVVGRCE